MSLVWFKIPLYATPAEALEAMQPFGVRLMEAHPTSARYFWCEDANRVMVWAGNHRVYDDGRIEVHPNSNLPTAYLIGLIAATNTAFNREPGTRWNRRRKSKTVPEPYYWSNIYLPADQSTVGRIARARTEEAKSERQRIELTPQQVAEAPSGNPTWL